MNLVLPPSIEKIIEDRVRSGRYQSAADVVAAAVAQLDVQEHAGREAADVTTGDGLLAEGAAELR
jgi:Arc/MetJ-type ribon-helix-helix transcriptional regulator